MEKNLRLDVPTFFSNVHSKLNGRTDASLLVAIHEANLIQTKNKAKRSFFFSLGRVRVSCYICLVFVNASCLLENLGEVVSEGQKKHGKRLLSGLN